MKKNRDRKWVSMPVTLIVVMAIPLLIRNNTYQLNIFLMICGYVVLANGLNILMGYSGQLSLGHAAFYGIGAYVCSVLRRDCNVPFLVGMIAAIALCVLVGLLFGLPACRQKGIFLALITAGFNTVINLILINWKSVTNGSAGLSNIPKLSFGGGQIGKLTYCYIYLGIVVIVMLLTYWVIRSKIGRALIAVRESEVAAEAMGINVSLYKCMAFALSAALAGIAGCMYSTYAGYIDPTSFTSNFSITVMAMVIIGGMGHLFGGVIGAVFVGVCLELLRSFADYQQLVYGLLMIIVVRFMPDGLSSIFGLGRRAFATLAARNGRQEGGKSV
ncbi:MAG: branched-chain amino acid ABC transporter permease [Lachnospiraceae bacterium]|nr:branched-chain amino acid ABC transporter permease [Lachnospiraceae bacterium]